MPHPSLGEIIPFPAQRRARVLLAGRPLDWWTRELTSLAVITGCVATLIVWIW